MQPRWSLALCSLPVAIVLGWAAKVLPWSDWTVFSVLTAAVAASHGVTGALALAGRGARMLAWRVQSMIALTYLAYCTWNVATSAVYVAELYGSLGRGIGVGLAACLAIVALLTLPLSVWGIVTTGGIGSRRRARVGAGISVMFVGVGLTISGSAALAAPRGDAEVDWAAALSRALPSSRVARGPERSLMTAGPARCAAPPLDAEVTLLVTFLAPDGRSNAVRRHCLQGETATDVQGKLRELLAGSLRGPIKVDVVTGVQPLRAVLPVVDSLLLRPGLDGACVLNRCLAPWQLVATEAFITHRPLKFIPELRFGVSPEGLHRAVGSNGEGVRGLTRIETRSFVIDADDTVHPLLRGRVAAGPEVDPVSLAAARKAAQDNILAAQADDGRFLYVLNPHTGDVSYRGFAVARQAGTTLVLCELGEDTPEVNQVVGKALDMLASLEVQTGDVGALHYPPGTTARRLPVGQTALSLISFLSCRERVGPVHDARIGRMARFLLTLQRPDGGFHPMLRVDGAEAIPGPDPLYAGGQAVFALTLLEKLAAEQPSDLYPAADEAGAAVERSMTYFANDYWPGFVRGFFFIEENWHCLAARASLGHHRNDDYERFCLDYVGFKRRLILDDGSDVNDDLLGAYGFGNVLIPHNTGTAGFGEALAAAMAIREARGDDLTADRDLMRRVLGFLLRQQWTEVECFACAPGVRVVGGMSEHIGSPHIRIDYVQHSWAAMGHGGRMLEG